jgi:hypothetical protein
LPSHRKIIHGTWSYHDITVDPSSVCFLDRAVSGSWRLIAASGTPLVPELVTIAPQFAYVEVIGE